MADEQITTESKPEGAEENISIARTELETIRQSDSQLKAIDARAKELGFPDTQTYLETIEAKAYENLTKTETPKPVVTQPAKVEVNPEIAGARQMAASAILGTQMVEYQMKQNTLPAESRSKVTRQELDAAIKGPQSGLIAHLASDPRFEGNVFLAADYLITVNKSLGERPPSPDSQRAANAATITPGTRVEAPGGQQPKPEDTIVGRVGFATNDFYTGEK